MAKPKKLITYVLMVSRVFPTYHPRKGEQTNFPGMITTGEKGHTGRPNYKRWAEKAAKVNAGLAVISLRYWSGKPYCSPQVEFAQLTSVAVTRFHVYQVDRSNWYDTYIHDQDVPATYLPTRTLIFINNSVVPLRYPFKFAARDGLTMQDFNAWFKKPAEDMALIHFDNFRY